MSETRKLATGVMLAVAVLYASPSVLMAESDNFDTDHTYWDGTTADVSGTIWDGVQGTAEGYVSHIDANQTNSGQLTMQITDTMSNSSSGNPFDASALFVEWTGNFDAKVQMPVMPPDQQFLTLSLGAWTADQANAVHVDNVRGLTDRVRFRDSDGPDENRLPIPNESWFRMTRIGDEFSGYYGPDGVSWTRFENNIIRDYGDTLRLGVAAWNTSNTVFSAQFDNFMVVVPEPSTTLLGMSGLMAMAAFQTRRKGN